MKVSAFLIARNHESSLGAALRSVAEFASEVLLVDTGSSDQTVAIATELGAKIIAFAWQDDFSAACNAAIAAARGDWLLWMNPDEELEPDGLPALAAAMDNPTAFLWQLGVRQLRMPDDRGAGVQGHQARLFRRDPALRFRGRLHPDFDPPVEDIAARREQSIGTVDATLRRHAYLSTPTPEKIRWVVRLLEKELEDRPCQVGFTIELGRNLLWLKDPRGHERLSAAANEVRLRSEEPFPPSPWVGSLIEYILTVSPLLYLGSLDRTEARRLAGKWFPRTPPVVWAVAGERFAAADHASAVVLLEQLLAFGRTGGYDDGGGFDPEILGAAAAVNYGTCCLHLGRWEDARAAFSSLVDHPKYGDAARRGERLAELRKKPGAR